jgi:Ca2+-binding EF-hand superfamily protein
MPPNPLLVSSSGESVSIGKQLRRKATGEKVHMAATVAVIVGVWLSIATVYYSRSERWPLAQSFFYAIDTGMSIGFGAVAEQRASTKLFTIGHVLLGASAVGGAIALFADSAISGAAAIASVEYARASVRAAFQRADSDGDNELSFAEFKATLSRCGIGALPEAQMAATLALFDADASGTIGVDEFLAIVQPHIDSNTPVDQALKKALEARQRTPLARILRSVWVRCDKNRILVLWLLWLAAGTVWASYVEDMGVVNALYFAIGALATGGLMAPTLGVTGTIPDSKALFVGLYCLTGIPIFAMALGRFANVLIGRHLAAREQASLSKPISEDEFEFASQLITNDGSIDLAEFIVLELYRTGKLDEASIGAIKAEFQRLDTDSDGTIRQSEILGSVTSSDGSGAVTGSLLDP